MMTSVRSARQMVSAIISIAVDRSMETTWPVLDACLFSDDKVDEGFVFDSVLFSVSVGRFDGILFVGVRRLSGVLFGVERCIEGVVSVDDME